MISSCHIYSITCDCDSGLILTCDCDSGFSIVATLILTCDCDSGFILTCDCDSGFFKYLSHLAPIGEDKQTTKELFIKVKVIRDNHCEVNVNFSSWSTELLKAIFGHIQKAVYLH